jgi:hypothetical protein
MYCGVDECLSPKSKGLKISSMIFLEGFFLYEACPAIKAFGLRMLSIVPSDLSCTRSPFAFGL